MNQNPSEPNGNILNASAQFGTVPNPSETFRNVPNSSESFRTIPRPSESFGSIRKESHTLTVREAARMFEAAGVARTERSIINWCQRNAMGVARLDAYFDPNDRRYYITQQSIESAIAEEKAKAFRNGQGMSEAAPNHSEGQEKAKTPDQPTTDSIGDSERGRALEQQLLDLKILNSGKDFYIQRLTEERDGFIRQMVEGSKKIGELETRLLQLEGPRSKGSNSEGSF
jgi:hypothetical protein